MCSKICLPLSPLITILLRYNFWLNRIIERLKSCWNQETCGQQMSGYADLSRRSRTWYSRLVGCKESCEEETPALETMIETGLDILLPFNLGRPLPTSLHGSTNNSNFEITSAKQPLLVMIKLAFVAFGILLTTSWWGPKYYGPKVEHLRDCEPRRWWKEVKSLGGMQSATHTDPTSVLKHIDSGSDSSPTSLANIINNAFFCPNLYIYSFGSWIFCCCATHRFTNGPLATVTKFRVLKKLTASFLSGLWQIVQNCTMT